MPEYVESVRLTEDGKKAINLCLEQNELYRFREIAGSHVVTSLTRGVSIDVIYNFNATSSEDLRKISMAFDLAYKTAKTGADVFSEINKKSICVYL